MTSIALTGVAFTSSAKVVRWKVFATIMQRPDPMDHLILPGSPIAAAMTVVGLVMGSCFWSKNKNVSEHQRPVGLAAVAGGLLGARLEFVIDEAPIWWHDEAFLFRMISGKTIPGALPGGWIGVEIVKRVLNITSPTGDGFARVIPIGISAGRIGCLVHGCCQGRPFATIFDPSAADWLARVSIANWPAPVIEIGFQFAFFLFSSSTRSVGVLRNRHFHLLYDSAGTFPICARIRSGHSPLRGKPAWPWLLFVLGPGELGS